MQSGHRLRTCRVREGAYHWRRMLAIKAEASWPGKDIAAEKDALQRTPSLVYGQYTHKCVACVALERKSTLQEAERFVKQPRSAKYVERYLNFKWAMEHAQEVFDFVEAEPADDLTAEARHTLLNNKKNEKYQRVNKTCSS